MLPPNLAKCFIFKGIVTVTLFSALLSFVNPFLLSTVGQECVGILRGVSKLLAPQEQP